MGDGTQENPYTHDDVLRLIKEHGGPEGLDLIGRWFEKGIDLRGLNLKGIILNEAKFQDELKMTGPQILNKPAQLQKVILERAQLQLAELALAQLQWANLASARLQEAKLLSANLQGAFMRKAQLQGANLGYTQLQGADLYGAKLQGAFLHGIKLSPDTKLEDANWGNYVLGEEKAGFFGTAADTYRRLKIWYTEHGIYNVAGKFFYREMEAKRKQLRWWPNPFPRAWSNFLCLICGYGERPLRVIGWAASVVFGLAAAYYFWGSFSSSSFWDTLYYSVASFTALGYGQWAPQPTGWAKGMGAAEAFIGVFTMALFIVTFVRKMTR